MMQSTSVSLFGRGIAVAMVLLLSGTVGLSQQKSTQPPAQEEENSRRFWPPEFRPAASAPSAKPRTGSYKPVAKTRPSPILNNNATEPATLGVTLWLLRSPEEVKQAAAAAPKPAAEPARSTAEAPKDETARVLVRKKKGNAEVTESVVAERVEANTPFKVGQLIRLSVEVPQDGYLYVIDREKYADGTVGEPYLIFPANPNSDEHLVKLGRIIELPDSENAFEVKLLSEDKNKQLTGELLSFLVTPRPLTGLPRVNPDDGPPKLSEALVAEWETMWAKSLQVEQLELEKGAGRTRTQAEQQALTGKDQKLNQSDPLPQTVFQVPVKRGNAFIVQMPLKIGK